MNAKVEDTGVDSRPPEERAREMGWYPKEEFHGDVSKWVDAETYIKRGEEFIPFLRANNRKLEQEVRQLKAKTDEQDRLIRATNAALAQLETVNTEQTRRAALEAKESIIEGIAEARKDGDVKKEFELTEQLESTNERIKAATTKAPPETSAPPATPPAAQDFTQTTEWQTFLKDNPWWQNDSVMRAASLAITQELAASGRFEDLTPSQRFALTAQETKKRFNIRDNPRRQEPSMVSSPSGGAGGGAGGRNAEQSYNDLPSDAQSACDRLAARFVGEGKKYKKIEDWRAEYTKTYFTT